LPHRQALPLAVTLLVTPKCAFMFKLVFFVISFFSVGINAINDLSVDAELLNPINEKGISLRVKVTNLSNKAIKVLKNRRHDFKHEKIRALGNYIIEIEKLETDKYELFSPSADIDPGFEKEEYVTMKKGSTLIDTVYISGRSFSRNINSVSGFPQGTYRLKISFNSSEWSDSQANSSNWLNFKIE
jgi:hypothetical protein